MTKRSIDAIDQQGDDDVKKKKKKEEEKAQSPFESLKEDLKETNKMVKEILKMLSDQQQRQEKHEDHDDKLNDTIITATMNDESFDSISMIGSDDDDDDDDDAVDDDDDDKNRMKHNNDDDNDDDDVDDDDDDDGGIYAYANLDFNILDHNTDKKLYKFGNLADVSYDNKTISMVSMTTSSIISIIDYDEDEVDDEDDEYIPAPTSIVPFSSNEMIPVLFSVPKEGKLFLLPDGADCIDVLIDPKMDTGHAMVQHMKLRLSFTTTRTKPRLSSMTRMTNTPVNQSA